MKNILKKDSVEKEINIDYRVQFTIIVRHKELGDILKGLAEHSVDIDAMMMLYNGGNQNIYKIVVGNNNIQKEEDITILRTILELCEISYNEKKVCRIKFLNTPNMSSSILEDIYGTLSNHIDIKTMYMGTSNSLYVESDAPLEIKNIITMYYTIKSFV